MIIGSKEVGLKNTSVSVTVPSNPTAKLMYYIKCISNVLPINQYGQLNRYVNYSQYYNLTFQEKQQLLAFCVLLRPDILMGKCIFLAPQLCINTSNAFYQINEINKVLAVSNSIIVGGQQKTVTKIMTFTMDWLQDYYLSPLTQLSQSLESNKRAITNQPVYRAPRQQYVIYQERRGCCCQIM